MGNVQQGSTTGGFRQADPPRKRAGVSALFLGCLLLAAAVAPLIVVAPASADPSTVDCGADPGASQCRRLTPTLNCVWVTTGSSTITAVFGYSNTSSHPIVAAVGSSNQFSPSPAGRGQPTSFPARTTVSNAFSVTWSSGGSITWTLTGHSVTASSSNTKCSSNPAPALAETGVILGCLVIAVLLSIAAFRERGAPRPARLIDRLLPR